MADILYKIAEKYTNFHVAGKQLQLPYAITTNPTPPLNNEGRTSKYSNYAGKGTAERIHKALIRTASRKRFGLKTASTKQIRTFMLENGIGIDCSGFVYNVLDEYLKQTGQRGLASRIYKYPTWKGRVENLVRRQARVRRISAKTLTSDLNTTKISVVKDMKVGDMIRLTHQGWAGKHIAIIVDIDKLYITYAHSAVYTKDDGVHFARIKIIDRHKGLDKQKWLEKTANGNPYGKDAFVPSRGDSVRRLKGL